MINSCGKIIKWLKKIVVNLKESNKNTQKFNTKKIWNSWCFEYCINAKKKIKFDELISHKYKLLDFEKKAS